MSEQLRNYFIARIEAATIELRALYNGIGKESPFLNTNQVKALLHQTNCENLTDAKKVLDNQYKRQYHRGV